MSYPVMDFNKTIQNTIKELDRQLKPIHYVTGHDLFCVSDNSASYSEKTSRREKYRQLFSEGSGGHGCFVADGYIYRKHWFKSVNTDLFDYDELDADEIDVNDALAVMHELSCRQAYLHDHFGDAKKESRQITRQHGFLAEYSVKKFFKTRWPSFFVDASNSGIYHQPSSDDFAIDISCLGKFFYVDVKQNDFLRNAKRNFIYIKAPWDADKKRAVMKGFVFNTVDRRGVSFIEDIVGNNHLIPIIRLVVCLNMAEMAMNYFDVSEIVGDSPIHTFFKNKKLKCA